MIALEDCYFYHAVDLPGYGEQQGEWDLRTNAAYYLGRNNLAGKRVLEIGAANGFLTHWMEQQGADVVPLDLSPDLTWDIVPSLGDNGFIEERRAHVGKVNNAFWLVREILGMRASLVYGSAYDVPTPLGIFDVATFGSVLLHLRDPFGALMHVAERVRESLILTDIYPFVNIDRDRPYSFFIPALVGVRESWWHIAPVIYAAFCQQLGFANIRITDHVQFHKQGPQPMWTITATREVAS